jgi:hypothetical protein
LLSRLLGSWFSLHRCGCAVEGALRYSVFDSALDRMHNAKWLFPTRGPHRQVFVCGVEVIATLHGVGDVNK